MYSRSAVLALLGFQNFGQEVFSRVLEEALVIPAGMASVKAMLEEVDGLVTDAKAPVTYRSLSRKLSVSSDIAKRYAPGLHTRAPSCLPTY
jgi:hypothetical protein